MTTDYDWPEWTPLHGLAMSNWLDAQNDDVEEWNMRDRHFLDAMVGLSNGFVNSIHISRGANKTIVDFHIQTIRDVSKDYKHNDYFGEPNEAQLAYDDKLKKFSEAPDSDVYFVFHEDCAGSNAWNDIWNHHEEAWDRLKVPYAEAVERIAKMEPLPPKDRKPFAIDPIFKEEIDKLIPKLVKIEDEDNAPYKLVVEQKAIRQALAMRFAALAANKFRLLIGGYKPPYVNAIPSPDGHMLTIEQCEYDNWNGWYDLFKKHCKIDAWEPRQYDRFPLARWDVSNDPDFTHSEQKVFTIKLMFYGAHSCGW